MQKNEVKLILALSLYKTITIVLCVVVGMIALPEKGNPLMGALFMWVAFSRMSIWIFLLPQVWKARLTINHLIGDNVKRVVFYELYEVKRFLEQRTTEKPTRN